MIKRKNVKTEEDELFSDLMQWWLLFKKSLKWIPLSIIACLIVAGFYIWFTPTTVSVTGKMELIDKSKQGSSGLSAGLAMLNSLPLNLGSSLGGAVSLGIDSEKEILKSNSLVRNVVKDLGLYTEYRLSKWGRKTLLYQNNPISISLDSAHVQWFDEELPLTYHQIQFTVTKSSNGYKVKTRLVEDKEKNDLPAHTFTTLPATIETEVGTLTITENILAPKQAMAYKNGYTLKITISPSSTVADSFINRLTLEPPSKTISNILNITLRDENQMRGLAFVNSLVLAYNQRANDEKNEEARKTDEFVNDRLNKIDVELGSSDDDWENSKKRYQITTPEVDAQEALTKKSEYEARLVSIGTQLEIHDYLSKYINDPKNKYELIPIGVMSNSSSNQNNEATGALSFINQHNQLVKQRKDLLKSVSDVSPQVQRLTESIDELRPTILLAMQRERDQLVIQKNTIDREYAKYSSRIGTAPQMERVFTEIGRQREIKQAVYLLLLQKREEAAMDLANTTDKGRLIDDVRTDDNSSKPKKKIVLLIALLFGTIIPVCCSYIQYLIKTKIDTLDELKGVSLFPVLSGNSSSDSDEVIRNLRTNLLFNLNSGQKTILVASQNEGDGKTFIAQHLVDSFTTIGKKALYVNADLRKEKCHPADIFASDDYAQQMAHAKKDNDYVIIDTPAIGEYTDVFQLAQFADVTLFVVKAGKTLKSEVFSLEESRLPQPMLVFNNFTIKK